MGEIPEIPTDSQQLLVTQLMGFLKNEKRQNSMHQQMLRNTQSFLEKMKGQIVDLQKENRELQERIEELEGNLSFYRQHVLPKGPGTIQQMIDAQEKTDV
jgi:uncharacterized protein YlxW (UPF0749 family)